MAKVYCNEVFYFSNNEEGDRLFLERKKRGRIIIGANRKENPSFYVSHCVPFKGSVKVMEKDDEFFVFFNKRKKTFLNRKEKTIGIFINLTYRNFFCLNQEKKIKEKKFLLKDGKIRKIGLYREGAVIYSSIVNKTVDIGIYSILTNDGWVEIADDMDMEFIEDKYLKIINNFKKVQYQGAN